MTSNFVKLSSQLVGKITRVTSLPAHHTDLVKRVSILKDELLTIVNSKEKLLNFLDQKGQWLFRSYRDGAGIIELMDQLFPHHYLALQVLEWRRRQKDYCIPLTSEEYAKGIKIAGRAKDINLAVYLFDEAAKKRIQTASVYNAMMGVYMCNGFADECQSLFRDFRRHCTPTVVTYNILISVYGRLLMVKNMEAAFEELRKLKLSPNTVTYNYLIAGYVTAWNWDKMESTFLELKRDGSVEPDTETYQLMLRGYANSGNLVKMEEMYEEIKDQVVGVNSGPLVRAMICAYCKKVVEDRIQKIENLLSLLSREEYIPWLNVLLIRLYAQEDIVEAMESKINEAFEHKTCINKSSIMRAIIAAYFRCNEVDNLANFVKRAESAGWKLCRSLYHCKILMYGSQKRFEEMEGVVNEMAETNYGLVTKTFAIMYKAYKNHGMESDAEKVKGKMLKRGL